MKYLYLPVYKMPVSYLYSFGRRWSVFEHMLLTESASAKRTALELARACDVPHRLVIEALINLLRANYVEVRSDDSNVYFAATPTGQKRALEKSLPEQLQRDIRWDTMCVERLGGHWARADDLDLIYEKDLPADAVKLEPLLHTFERNDAALRDLFRLNPDESLEPTPPVIRPPSFGFARIGIAFDAVQTGLPTNAPIALKEALLRASREVEDDGKIVPLAPTYFIDEQPRDDLAAEDLIVGGGAHWMLLHEVFEKAKSAVVLHSCFISPETLRSLLPDLEKAARRRVKVDLLWGLYNDPETDSPPKKIFEAAVVLSELSATARGRVSLSPVSSGSHAKVIVYDDRDTDKWTTIVGSCNFLSSDFDWMEVSVRTRSSLFATKMMSRLLSAQLPAVGNWSGTARRLNAIWSDLKHISRGQRETGAHSITLVVDGDHYACIAKARDNARKEVQIVCDLYGLAAETSVIVPMEAAAEKGVLVKIAYTRASRFLLAEQSEPNANDLAARNIVLERVNDVHAKYLTWDDDSLVVTSFNWMATALSGGRSRGAEIGALIEGPGIRVLLSRKLTEVELPEASHGFDASEVSIPS